MFTIARVSETSQDFLFALFRPVQSKKLCKFLGNMYPHVDFQVVFQSAKRIENLFPFKDRIPTNICSSVV